MTVNLSDLTLNSNPQNIFSRTGMDDNYYCHNTFNRCVNQNHHPKSSHRVVIFWQDKFSEGLVYMESWNIGVKKKKVVWK